jgi:hypothetical protein
MAYDIECWFDRLRQQAGSSVALASDVGSVFQEPKSASKPTDSHAEISFEPVTRQVMTVSKVCDLYLNDPTSSRTEKSAMTYRTTFATISAILGPETPLKSINREVCRELLEVLRSLPTNAKKRWPQLSPREVAAMANAQGIQPMSLANVNEYMNKLSTLFNWAVKEEIVIRNPAKGLKIANDMAPRDKRKPFSTQQLGRIFNAPLYRGCQIASKRDPLFASKNDPLGVQECHVSTGFGSAMGIGLLERLERREGIARPEFQPLQQQILLSAGRRVSCGF